jgi:hypothetical protein
MTKRDYYEVLGVNKDAGAEAAVVIKPHHLLDIFKLYGAGCEHFVPDLERGHNFWSIGNQVLSNPYLTVEFTDSADDICLPCEFLKNGRCTDQISKTEPGSKAAWNNVIEQRLMDILNVQNGTQMSAAEFCFRSLELLTKSEINYIWYERPAEETEKRARLLGLGLKKYADRVEQNAGEVEAI